PEARRERQVGEARVGEAAVAEPEPRAPSVQASVQVASDGPGRRDPDLDPAPESRPGEVDRVPRAGRAEAKERHPPLPGGLPDLNGRAAPPQARSVRQAGKAIELEAAHAAQDRDRRRDAGIDVAKRPAVAVRDR